MTSGFGVDATSDGLSGTSSSDIRKIFGALYSPGIVSGCTVTTSATTMEYTVSAGVVAISTSSGETVLAPVPTTTVSTTAPTSGTKTDIVYVQQRYPSIEGDAEVSIGVGTALPGRALALRQFSVAAGQSNTNAAVAVGGVDYSIPYGASLGELYKYKYTTTGLLSNSYVSYGSGSFYVPTDRRVRISVSACLHADGAVYFDNSKYVEMAIVPRLDGTDKVTWTTPGLHMAFGTYNFDTYVDVSAGKHTISFGMFRSLGYGTSTTYYGTDSNGYWREGISFRVDDAGPIV